MDTSVELFHRTKSPKLGSQLAVELNAVTKLLSSLVSERNSSAIASHPAIDIRHFNYIALGSHSYRKSHSVDLSLEHWNPYSQNSPSSSMPSSNQRIGMRVSFTELSAENDSIFLTLMLIWILAWGGVNHCPNELQMIKFIKLPWRWGWFRWPVVCQTKTRGCLDPDSSLPPPPGISPPRWGSAARRELEMSQVQISTKYSKVITFILMTDRKMLSLFLTR